VKKEDRGKLLECDYSDTILQAFLELLQHTLLQILWKTVVVQEYNRGITVCVCVCVCVCVRERERERERDL